MPDDSQTLLGNIVVQPQDAIVFVLQDEQLAVYRENTFAKWQAVPALARIFSLSFNNPLMPVYVAAARDHFTPRTSRAYYSPTEVLAMLMSGVSGVWEISPELLDDRYVKKLDFSALRSAWTAKAKFVYGEPARQLHKFRNLVTSDDWPKEGYGRTSPRERYYARYSFRVAMALSCLSVEEMAMDEGLGHTMANYAKRLVSLESKTGCVMAVDMVTHALGALDRGWSQRIAGYNKKARSHMPEWSRIDGFPGVQPVLSGQSPDDIHVAEAIYETLSQLTFGLNPIDNKDWDPESEGNPMFTTIYFPRRTR